ncbi:hypothetical protein BJ875DRAFT_483055 [Amylocarpus encephaloides]|uniref:2EXR domain-containing protein n=1 Tax=Amylocarpus encephaloides TaxID=45428 RepID=A0A9P7YLC4_9HELO|nr:hypothetical protein BJ875DRAFT_483055 [Amylocarpus encephaloides]
MPTQPSQSQHTNQFTLFPKLPLELRRRIWRCAALPFTPKILAFPIRVKLQTPALLRANKEARSEVLGLVTIWLWDLKDLSTIRDIMYIDSTKPPKIPRIAIDIETWLCYYLWATNGTRGIEAWWDILSHTQELLVVVERGYIGNSWSRYGMSITKGCKELVVPGDPPHTVLKSFKRRGDLQDLFRRFMNADTWDVLNINASAFVSSSWQDKVAQETRNGTASNDTLLKWKNWKTPKVGYYMLVFEHL